ncbi:MAG: hypothetical protein JXB15_04110 [Anaerolineales bacterium]|nr:hypothetical protein [Anaerolineales bacterium]
MLEPSKRKQKINRAYRTAWRGLLLLLVMILLLSQSSLILAAPDATYAVDWWTVDGGGMNHKTGGVYSMSSTSGQPDASAALSGGVYSLQGGFWVIEYSPQWKVHLPRIAH